MTDTSNTPATPAKATPAKATRATMAPAARSAEGADDDRGSWLNRSLQGVSVDDLQTLRNRIDKELRRKAAEPSEPSFGISEGTRDELEQRDRAADPSSVVVSSPFTGRPLDKDGEPVADDDK